MKGTLSELRNDNERRSSSRGAADSNQKHQSKGSSKEKTFMERWVEPALAQAKASYEDHGAGPFGVLEHMQPLGEAPSTKLKQKVKGEGTRKSVLGRSAAAAGTDTGATPEGTPAPAASTSMLHEVPTTQPVVIDDERDADYAPAVNGKNKERLPRSRAVKRKSEPAVSSTARSLAAKKEPPKAPDPRFEYDGEKLKRVVEAAKARALEVGKPDLAAAVNEIYIQSQLDFKLRILLEAILTQNATGVQNLEFQNYVRAAKKKLKDRKAKTRHQPAVRTNRMQEKVAQRFQTNLTSDSSFQQQKQQPDSSAALPSTELLEPSKHKLSLKVKSPAKDPNRRRPGNGNMSGSPRKRAGSDASDSSLTSLTSNDDDDDADLDEPEQSENSSARPSTAINGVQGKDHAAERGSLAIPGGSVKRSSADADAEDDDREQQLAAKRQKLSEGIARDSEYPESSVRPSIPPPLPKTRALQRVRENAFGRPSLRLDLSGRAGSTRGSRAVSTDVDSPLSDLSPPGSRQSTPRVLKGATKPVGKRAKTKQSPEKKQLGALGAPSGAGGAGGDSPIGDDDNEEASENNDFCSACRGSGYLLCCDGCDRSFHFTCLDPPLNEHAKELDEPWFCYLCVAKRPLGLDSPEKPGRGLFAPLLNGLRKRNPTNFVLPEDLRTYYEGVTSDRNGSFVEALNGKPLRNKPGYSDDQPNYFKLRDSKSNLVLCYSCSKSSLTIAGPQRPIVSCDHCGQHWHLDCLDPPLANPPALNQNGKKVHDWMCPLHVDQALRSIDAALLNRRRIHVRKPKAPRVMETSLTRGHMNNGVIEVFDDSDASESEFYDEGEGVPGTVYKLPSHGIKLDFIDKVKDTRVQHLRDERAHQRLEVARKIRALENAAFAKRPFNEQQLALNLAQFANDNNDLDLGSDQVENLVGTLIAEAPTEVVEVMMAAEEAEKIRAASSVWPSPPGSDKPAELSTEQRKELEMLQELIRRRLQSGRP